MPGYYETVSRFSHLPSKITAPPGSKGQFDMVHYREKEARNLIWGLSGIVYGLALKGYMERYSESAASALDIASYFDEQQSKMCRKNKDKVIEERRNVLIPSLVPRGETIPSDVKVKELSMVGLAALGIAGTVFVDKIGEAAVKYEALSILLKNDPMASFIYSLYPHLFRGYRSAEEFSQFQTGLNNSELKKIYEMANL